MFGATSVAGYTIAIRVIIFALMPAWGLANAAATLVGQNLGAQQPERAARAVRIALRYNVIFLGTFGALFIAFAQPIAGVFTDDPVVFDYAQQALWVVSLAFPFYAAGMCFEAAFNGAGDTWTPTRLNFFCLWLGQVPLAWVMATVVGLGPTGVFIAVPSAFTALTIWSWFLFKRGRWQGHQV
jgi:Na+-driven multidrug efflux pump